MVPNTTRRRLLVTTGTAALTGSVASAQEGSERSSERSSEDDQGSIDADPLPDAVAAVLDPIPESVDDDAVQTILLATPVEETEQESAMPSLGQVDAFGLEAADVDRVATAGYGETALQGKRVLVASGSFAEGDVDPELPGASDVETVHVDDGVVALASGDVDDWQGELTSSSNAAEESDTGILGEYAMDVLLAPVSDQQTVHVVRMNEQALGGQDLDVDHEDVEFAAVARETVDETTQEQTFVFLFDDADAAGSDPVEALVESSGTDADASDASYETEGRRTVATLTTQLPEYRLPDDSPDVRFHFEYQGDGAVRIDVRGAEAADPENLEFRVDGEVLEEPPWADRTEAIEPGTSFETSADLFTTVEVRWIDPEREGVSHSLGQTLLGSFGQVFEESYDHETTQLTVRYVGDDAVDPSRLSLVHRGVDQEYGEAQPESLSERVDELSEGAEVVVDDVGYGDAVSIRVDADDDTRSYAQSVYHFSPRPPGAFQLERTDGDASLIYRGEEPQPADQYRIAFPANDEQRWTDEFEPHDVQWADEYETIEPGDSLDLGDLELGTFGRVEWTAGDESIPVAHFRVEPDVSFSATYDEEAEEVELAHEDGVSLDADELTVTAYRGTEQEQQDAFEDYDEVAEGDTTVVELPGDEQSDDERPDDAHTQVFLVVEYGDGLLHEYVRVPTGDDPTGTVA